MKQGLYLVNRAARSKIAKSLAKIAIENAPELYKKRHQ